MAREIGYCIFTFEGGDWTNDNFEGLDRGFAAARELGYAYVEVPSYVYRAGSARSDFQFLHRMGRVFALSERHGVPLSAIFAAADLLDDDALEEEADQLVVLARLVSTIGVRYLPVTLSMGRTGEGTDEAARLGERMSEVGRRTLEHGVKLAAHPHIDCPLESPAQIAAFGDAADPEAVWLALDTGHVLAGGGDPVEIATTYAGRTAYVHLKDLDQAAYRGAAGRDKYLAFRDPGKGDVDFPGVLAALERAGFDGPILAENDMSPDPRASMAQAYAYVRDELRL